MLSNAVKYIEDTLQEFDLIASSRKSDLDALAKLIANQRKLNKKVAVSFICTHNSRRSQLCEVWFAIAAHWYKQKNIRSFSAGVEVTAYNQNAVEAVNGTGLFVNKTNDLANEGNPIFATVYDYNYPVIQQYSKLYSAIESDEFIAVMVCDHADENCPIIPNCTHRFSLRFQDPKSSDGTAQQSEVYAATCRLIAREMLYLVSRIY